MGNIDGLKASIGYIIFYCLSLLMLFLLVLNCKENGHHAISYVSELKKLHSGGGLLAPFLFTLVVFSFAGIPPLTSF